MIIGTSRLGRFLLPLLAVVSLAGCPKKDDAKKDEATKDEAKKGGDEGGGYSDGDVLAHMPQKCPMGRIYVNFGLIVKDPAVKPLMKKLDSKIAESMKGDDGEKFEAAMKALQDADIEPAKDVHEFALCMRDKKDMIMAFGGDFSGKDPLAAIQKAAVAAEEDKPKKKEQDGISYLATKKVNIALVQPNVLAFGEDLDEVIELEKKQDVSDDWHAGKGRLVAFQVNNADKGMDIFGMLTDEGDDIQVKGTMEMSGAEAKKLKSDPDSYSDGIKEFVTAMTEKLDGTPLAPIADDLKAVKVKVSGNTITLTAKIPSKHLGSALKKIMEASEEDLEAAFK